MPLTSDTYAYAKNVPLYGYKDDVHTLMDLCNELNFNYYPYGGMVLQLEPERYILSTSRWFVSFTELNNGRQIFHEASGNGYVYNAHHHPEAFKHFLAELQGKAVIWKVIG